jgi:hypothetical protein
MAAPRNSTRANLVEFKGLQNARDLEGIQFGAFISAENTDINREGKPERRPGRIKVYDGGVRDTWGDGEELLFVTTTGELRRLDTEEGTEVMRSGLPSVGRLNAARVSKTLYWSYGTASGVIENGTDRALGLAQLAPAGVVSISSSARLAPGTYRYAWAGVTSEGEEGPVGVRGTFELSSAGGVYLVPPIPSDARMDYVRAYLTEVNGTMLYRLGMVNAPTDTVEQAARYIEAMPELAGVRPSREDKHALPAFSAAGVHNGRLIVAYEDMVLYSDRFDYEFFEPDQNFIPFSSKVHLVAPVKGGLFVGTQTDHYFLDGADIAGASLDHTANYGAIPNTLAYIEQKEHGFEVDSRIAVWTGARGPVFGLPGGQMEDAGDGVVSYPANVVYGAGAVRKTAGDMHYISVVRHRESGVVSGSGFASGFDAGFS